MIILARLEAFLVPLGGVLGRLGTALGSSWDVLGRSGAVLDAPSGVTYGQRMGSVRAGGTIPGGCPPPRKLVNKFTSELVNEFTSEYIVNELVDLFASE